MLISSGLEVSFELVCFFLSALSLIFLMNLEQESLWVCGTGESSSTV